MKKRWIPLGMVALLLMLQVGLFQGSNMESVRQNQLRGIVQRWSTNVAVVNADAGVMLDGVRQSYTAAIIETLSDNFVVVSPAMAQSGYSSGAFGAILTFPSDVSERIISFNSNDPQRVQLEFMINSNLPEQEYIEIHTEILDLQLAINNTIASTFVGSVFRQFYEAQNQIRTVFDNDDSNMRAAEEVQLLEFAAALALNELPVIPLEPREMDVAQRMVELGEFGETISSMYRDSYDAASDSYRAMREDLISATDNFPVQEENWLEELTDWTTISVDFGEHLAEYSAAVRYFEDNMVEWFQQNVTWNEALTQYQSDVASWHEAMNMWFGDAVEWHEQYQIYLDAAVAYMEEVTEYRASIAEAVTLIEADFQLWQEAIAERAQALVETYQAFIEALAYHNEDIAAVNAYRDAVREWAESLGEYRGGIASWQTGLTGAQTQLQGMVTNLQNSINAFPPRPVFDDFILAADPQEAYDQALEAWLQALRNFSVTWPDFSAVTIPGGPTENMPEMDPNAALPEPREPFTHDLEYPWVPEYDGAILPPEWDLDFPEPGTQLPDSPTLDSPVEYDGSEEPETVGEGPTIDALQPDDPNVEPPPRPDDFWASLNQMHNQINQFEIDAYLTESIQHQVAQMLAAYEVYLESVREDLINQFAENIQQMHIVHDSYTIYLMELRGEVLQTEFDLHEDLRGTMERFSGIADGNSQDTRRRLGTFANMMPENRAFSGFNQNLIDFTVSPFELRPPAIRPALLANDEAPVLTFQQEFGRFRWILPVAAGTLFLSVAAVSIVMWLRKRKQAELVEES